VGGKALSCNRHIAKANHRAMFRHAIAEFIGTTFLLATVVGSGIMGDTLSGGNVAIALLANALATGAMLFVLINVFGPLSGAHFNPVVTVAMAATNRLPKTHIAPYIFAQVIGAAAGVMLAHAMFEQSLLQISSKIRWGNGQWVAEVVAIFGLLLTIFALLRHNADRIPQAVALYILGAYWFTASTSFANPAVTLARSLTNTFSGIAPSCMLPFVIAQIVGALLALVVSRKLFAETK
jgi:glycerol uptake facilitator-like aquaporin